MFPEGDWKTRTSPLCASGKDIGEMSVHHGSWLLAFPCSLPLLLTKEQGAYISLCLCHNSFISALLFFFKSFGFLYCSRDQYISKPACNSAYHYTPALASLVHPHTGSPAPFSLWLHPALGHRQSVKGQACRKPHTVLQNLSATHMEGKVNLHSSPR